MIEIDQTVQPKAPQDTIAQIVALFATAAPSPIPVEWLGARAFWSIGDDAMAAGIAITHLPQLPDAIDALQRTGYPPALAWLLHLGILRPQRWQHAPEMVTWILDVSKLRHDEFGELALPSQKTLQLVLDSVVSLWDEHSGAGALAIKGWPRTKPNRRRTAPLPTLTRDEVEAICHALLARHKALRNWQTTPRLLCLN